MTDMPMRDVVPPIAGTEDPSRPTLKLTNDDAGTGRDLQTDARTISEIQGQMSHELDMSGWLLGDRAVTLGEEKQAQGWQPKDTPEGAPPRPLETSGTRGAADIGEV